MSLIELSDYTVAPEGSGNGIKECNFSISRGEVCCISTDNPDDARLFLKALTTLVYPLEGIYRYDSKQIDFSDKYNLLAYKKKIGYVGNDSAMVSNRTVRENLLFMRNYFEDSMSIGLDENAMQLCEAFNILGRLDSRPGMLDHLELKIAVTIRELTKSPDILIMERPEDLMVKGHSVFLDYIKKKFSAGLPAVFISNDRNIKKNISNKKIFIKNGRLSTEVTSSAAGF